VKRRMLLSGEGCGQLLKVRRQPGEIDRHENRMEDG
jgi:hypothetical protein